MSHESRSLVDSNNNLPWAQISEVFKGTRTDI
jgi:hypothetical protein